MEISSSFGFCVCASMGVCVAIPVWPYTVYSSTLYWYERSSFIPEYSYTCSVPGPVLEYVHVSKLVFNIDTRTVHSFIGPRWSWESMGVCVFAIHDMVGWFVPQSTVGCPCINTLLCTYSSRYVCGCQSIAMAGTKLTVVLANLC